MPTLEKIKAALESQGESSLSLIEISSQLNGDRSRLIDELGLRSICFKFIYNFPYESNRELFNRLNRDRN
jgi:hypothetical protein